MNQIVLRDAAQDEIPMVRKQRLQAYQEYTSILNSFHWEALSGTLSSDADLETEVDVIIAETTEGIILGSVVLFPAKTMAYGDWTDALDYPEIRMLAVNPEARGKGIGKKLVNECVRRTKEKGFTKIGLHTGSFMTNAMKLYEGMGFKRTPEYDFEPANDGIIVQAYVLDLSS